MPQPAADPRPLTGEPLCLDLLNTQWVDESGPHDLLDTLTGLATWLRSADLHDRATADAATRDTLLETRAALLAALRGPHPTDALNRVLAHGAIHPRLGPNGPETQESVDPPHWLPAWLAAADYLHILSTSPNRIRHCAHPHCVLHFLDTTKNGTRRWCSMSTCGNRTKAARHYQRTKPPA